MASALQTFSAVVERIYDAALSPDVWPEIPGQLASLHAASQAILFAVRLPGVESGFYYTHGLAPAYLEVWNSGAARDDVWVAGALARNKFVNGVVAVGEELVDDEDFLKSDFYRRFLKPQDSRYLMAGVVFDGRTDGFPVSCCSMMRGHAGRPFDESNMELHRLVTNHISKAMGTMWRLRASEMEIASTHAALDRLPSGVLLIRGDGVVAFANARARATLERANGVALRGSPAGDRLTFSSRDAARRFESLVHEAIASDAGRAASHFTSGIRIGRKGDKGGVLIMVAPLGRSNAFSRGEPLQRAIVFISDADEPVRLDATLLSGVYDLTPAEVRLCEAIVSGGSLPEIAASLWVSSNTVRTQLRSVFEKTGAHRQAKLVRLLMPMRVGDR